MKYWVLISATVTLLSGCQQQPAEEPIPDSALARTHASDMPAAYHEFQVFGEDRTYFSHYAMFSSIHAYQVVLEVELTDEANAAVRAFRAGQPETGLSFSPSEPSDEVLPVRHDWVLPEETRPGRTITGDIHWVAEGDDWADPAMRHFIARNVSARVIEVVRREMFYPDTLRAESLSYIVIGRGDDLYLAHVVTQDPDFDQILRITAQNGGPAQGSVLSLDRPNALDERLQPGQTVRMTDAQGRAFSITAHAELALEILERQH